jgi:hypothetical protein
MNQGTRYVLLIKKGQKSQASVPVRSLIVANIFFSS